MKIKLMGYIEILIFLLAFVPIVILTWQFNFKEKENIELVLICMLIGIFPFLINLIHMLVSAINKSSVLWAMIIFFVPLGNFVYYLFIYVPSSEKYNPENISDRL